MAIVFEKKIGSATICIDDSCLPRTPEEKALRDRQIAAVVMKHQQDPGNRERLRLLNLEKYGGA